MNRSRDDVGQTVQLERALVGHHRAVITQWKPGGYDLFVRARREVAQPVEPRSNALVTATWPGMVAERAVIHARVERLLRREVTGLPLSKLVEPVMVNSVRHFLEYIPDLSDDMAIPQEIGSYPEGARRNPTLGAPAYFAGAAPKRPIAFPHCLGPVKPSDEGSRNDHAISHTVRTHSPSHVCENSDAMEKPRPGRGFGGAEGIRTPDLLNAIQTRSQLRHSPMGWIVARRDRQEEG